MATKGIALKLNLSLNQILSQKINNSNGEQRARSKFELRNRCIV